MSDVAHLLDELIRYPTHNPEGDELPLARALHEKLAALNPDALETVEVVPDAAPPPGSAASKQGVKPHAYVFARWGTPTLLVNAHIDTVPPGVGWTAGAWTPVHQDGKIYGLGAADTKGAVACILAALAAQRPRNLAVLFSGDEEHGGSCVRAFLTSPHSRGLTHAIVCEPTACRVGTRHRGIAALAAETSGPGGHSSHADEIRAPIAELARLAVALKQWGDAQRDQGPAGFKGMCLNIAAIDGGTAFNVIPNRARMTFSLRPPPGANVARVIDEVRELCEKTAPEVTVTALFHPPSFATADLPAFERYVGALVREPLDLGFWTEAALLAERGIDAVVFGPGNIAQAHQPDEWVSLEQLARAQSIFHAMFAGL